MESQFSEERNQVIITLTHDECIAIAGGQTVADRNNPFDPMAKVEIRPLSELDPTYEPLSMSHPDYAHQLGEYACQAQMLGNDDIVVFVPEALAHNGMVATETIAADTITGDPELIPSGGIRIEFGDTVGPHNREREDVQRREDLAEAAARQ